MSESLEQTALSIASLQESGFPHCPSCGSSAWFCTVCAATPAQDAQDAKRYLYAVQHLSLAHQLGIKPKPISCPDKIEGCLVAHYAPITKAEVDAAIDAAMLTEKEGG